MATPPELVALAFADFEKIHRNIVPIDVYPLAWDSAAHIERSAWAGKDSGTP